MTATFVEVAKCWVCDGTRLDRVHEAIVDLDVYRDEHPELAAYSGTTVWLRGCRDCGFVQPEQLPSLPTFFEYLYDQRWSPAWVRQEFESTYKDLIFSRILAGLSQRVTTGRRLLDVGAHAGRFLFLARAQGWEPEGIELNPRTAAFARERSGSRVHQVSIEKVALQGERFDAIALTDVLEHIPKPVEVLSRVRDALVPGGWVAIKVPCWPAQAFKEKMRALIRRGYRPRLADNLVHVNHFDSASLTSALRRAGFDRIAIAVAPPELPPGRDLSDVASRGVRRTLYAIARIAPAGHRWAALNLQAFARKPH